jgi:CMP-N-acetylneuraminic acid synthetase
MMQIAVAVFARAGSKGVPGKNLLEFKGKSLTRRALEQAAEIVPLHNIFVSTDSQAIIDEALNMGANAPFIRPAELCSDKSPELHSWKHLLNYFDEQVVPKPTVLVVLPVTSPLRSVSDIIGAVELFKKNQSRCDLVVSINNCRKNPYFNMLESDGEDYLCLSKPSGTRASRRQETPQVWEMNNAIYVGSANFLSETEDILNGRVLGYEMPAERSLDIDTYSDVNYLKYLEVMGDL